METTLKINPTFATHEKLLAHLKADSPYEASIEYDHWDIRQDAKGQMEKCIVIKKNNMHGVKAFFENENELRVDYIIPNKMMNAYFGKSQKARQSVLEIIGGKVKNTLLAGSQKKAFDEMIETFNKIKV